MAPAALLDVSKTTLADLVWSLARECALDGDPKAAPDAESIERVIRAHARSVQAPVRDLKAIEKAGR